MIHFRPMTLSAIFFAMSSGVGVWAHDLGAALPHPHPHPIHFGAPQFLFGMALIGGIAMLATAFLARKHQKDEMERASIRFKR